MGTRTRKKVFVIEVMQKALKSLLLIAGIVEITVGIAVGAYAIVWLRPRVNSLTMQLRSDLENLDRALLSQESITLLTGIAKNGNELIQLTPNLLLTFEGSTQEAAAILDVTGQAAEKTTKGLTGLFEPKQAIRLDVAYMRNAAVQLRLLAYNLSALRSVSVGLARDVSQLTRRIDPRQIEDIVKQMHIQIQLLLRYLQDSTVSSGVVLLLLGLSGICCLLGLFAIALGSIYANTLEIRPQLATYSRDLAA